MSCTSWAPRGTSSYALCYVRDGSSFSLRVPKGVDPGAHLEPPLREARQRPQ